MITKRTDTFKKYQHKKQEYRKQMLNEELAKLHHDKTKFETITHLARRAADMLHQRELIAYYDGKLKKMPHKIFPSTLLRNNIYRVLLLSYQSGKITVDGTVAIGRIDMNKLRKANPALDAYLGAKELQINELNAELELLHNMQSNAIEPSSTLNRQNSEEFLEKPNINSKNEVQLIKDDLDKIVTALFRIIEEIEFYEIDYEKKTIIDKSRFGEELIDRKLLKPFFDRIGAFAGFRRKGGAA